MANRVRLALLLIVFLSYFLPPIQTQAQDDWETEQMLSGGSVVVLDGGAFHSLAVKDDGTVWAWGWNVYGQVGDETTTDRQTAVRVSGLTRARAVSAGDIHSLALRDDGTVWAWGSNCRGQLGTVTTNCLSSPTRVDGLTDVVGIAAGEYHSLAVKDDGTVWAWGWNEYGQLGDATITNRSTPVQVCGLGAVVAVAARGNHSLALASDGTVWAWGWNKYGQLGFGTTTDRSTPVQVSRLTGVASVSAGGLHSLALKDDGTVWAWGRNVYGELGDGSSTNHWTPVQVSRLTGVASISAGGLHSLALKNDGTVWAWGFNANGQLGDGTRTDRQTPMQVIGLKGMVGLAAGQLHSLAVQSDGTVWAWGLNSSGQLGDGTTVTRSTPAQVKGLAGVGLPNVVINEIMQNPRVVSDSGGEWIELFNAGTMPADIDGWILRDNGTDRHVINHGGPLILEPGAFIVLGRNSDRSINGDVQVDYQYDNFFLGNNADEVILMGRNGSTIIDDVSYDGGPSFPDPEGASMELTDPLADNADGRNWSPARTPFGAGDLGTPGAPNIYSNARIQLSTEQIDFGEVVIGEDSVANIDVMNSGTQTLEISALMIDPPDAGSEISWTMSDTQVLVQQTEVLTVTFEPTREGLLSAALVIQSNDPLSPVTVVNLSGIALISDVPALFVLPASLDFGEVVVGNSSTREIRVYNFGTFNLEIDEVTADGAGFSTAGLEGRIEPGESKSFSVTFQPSQPGVYSGTITIESNDPGGSAEIRLSGSGIPM